MFYGCNNATDMFDYYEVAYYAYLPLDTNFIRSHLLLHPEITIDTIYEKLSAYTLGFNTIQAPAKSRTFVPSWAKLLAKFYLDTNSSIPIQDPKLLKTMRSNIDSIQLNWMPTDSDYRFDVSLNDTDKYDRYTKAAKSINRGKHFARNVIYDEKTSSYDYSQAGIEGMYLPYMVPGMYHIMFIFLLSEVLGVDPNDLINEYFLRRYYTLTTKTYVFIFHLLKNNLVPSKYSQLMFSINGKYHKTPMGAVEKWRFIGDLIRIIWQEDGRLISWIAMRSRYRNRLTVVSYEKAFGYIITTLCPLFSISPGEIFVPYWDATIAGQMEQIEDVSKKMSMAEFMEWYKLGELMLLYKYDAIGKAAFMQSVEVLADRVKWSDTSAEETEKLGAVGKLVSAARPAPTKNDRRTRKHREASSAGES